MCASVGDAFGALRIEYKVLIDQFNIQLDESTTAIHQLHQLGFSPSLLTDIILTHGDFDHAGGLADFTKATVHLSQEEYETIARRGSRYLQSQFSHNPRFITYKSNTLTWNELPAREIYRSEAIQIVMIPLFGHTHGHCGVAIQHEDKWLLYAGDAFYLDREMHEDGHPVTSKSEVAAEDNAARIKSFNSLKNLKHNFPLLQIYPYHDINTFQFLN